MNSSIFGRKAKRYFHLLLGTILVLLFSLSNGYSQVETNLEPFLLLEKPGKKKRIRYYVGDEIEFLFTFEQ